MGLGDKAFKAASTVLGLGTLAAATWFAAMSLNVVMRGQVCGGHGVPVIGGTVRAACDAGHPALLYCAVSGNGRVRDAATSCTQGSGEQGKALEGSDARE